jgi:heptosyltransferase I
MTDLLSARRILLCLRYGIGDVVMETPVLEALRGVSQGAFISAIGARPAIELLEDDPRVDELTSIQDWGLTHWGDCGSREIKEGLSRWILGKGHDLILDPSHAVIALKEVIWEQEVTILDSTPHVQGVALSKGADGIGAIKMAVQSGWGLEVPSHILPSIHLEPEIFRFVSHFLQTNRSESRPLIGISPVSSSPLKCWPIERLAEVADAMIERKGARILLFSGPQQERAVRTAACMRNPEKIAIVGSFHLKRVAGLLSRCDLLICNDTGLMHMAAAVGTPVVAAFGPTSPRIYLPSSPVSIALEGEDEACPHRKTGELGPSKCLLVGRCLRGDRSCIGGVEVKAVLKAAEFLLPPP